MVSRSTLSGNLPLMNVEALRPLVSPATHRWPVVRFFARAYLLPVMLAAPWDIAVAGVSGECQAGVILTCESCLSVQTESNASSVPPGDSDRRECEERYRAEQHSELPSGTGASNGGAPLGISAVAAFHQPSGFFPPRVLYWFLEERQLSLPDSPVFDRLRPPRIP